MRAIERDRGGAGRKLLIVVIVLAALAVAADRIGNAVAERYAADTIQKSQGLPHRPNVDITGFPFLTQLASGNFAEIVLSDTEVPIASRPVEVRISTITVTLHRVHVAHNLSSVHADLADAVATMDYADLGRALGGARVRYVGHGRVVATASVRALGRQYSGSISAAPRLTNDTLTFGATRVNGVGTITAAAAAALRHIFEVRLPLGGIPFGVQVQSLHADRSGLQLALLGRNLSYSH